MELIRRAQTLRENKESFFAITYLFLGIEGGILIEEGISALSKIIAEVEGLSVPEDERLQELHVVTLDYMHKAVSAHELKKRWIDSSSTFASLEQSNYSRAAFEVIELSRRI